MNISEIMILVFRTNRDKVIPGHVIQKIRPGYFLLGRLFVMTYRV